MRLINEKFTEHLILWGTDNDRVAPERKGTQTICQNHLTNYPARKTQNGF